MSSTSGSRRRKQQLRKSVTADEAQPEQMIMPYDENLLERVRTQWQFGDWDSLVRLERNTIQHHPDRSKLALLAAAGQFQTGRAELGRQYVRLAQDWGCGETLVMQVLAAGVHNSLGRAAAQAGNAPRALRHFESAIQMVSPGSDSRLLLRARSQEQYAQLGLKAPETSGELQNHRPTQAVSQAFSLKHVNDDSPMDVDAFFSTEEGERARALSGAADYLADCAKQMQVPTVDWVSVVHRSHTYFFLHFFGDYIPKKMAEKGQFYESAYLNLLARLHQPGGLIIDGGANIGNHAVFFAGVMGAPVIAFEPQPFNYGCLLANVYLNRLEAKVDVRQVAIGDRSGQIELVQALEGNYGSFTADPSIVKSTEDEKGSSTSFPVPVSTLDAELVDYQDAVSIIKLDLEGMEPDALRGAKNIIERSLPVIAVECFTKSVYQEIKNLLGGMDYFVIDSTNATPTFIFLSRRNSRHMEALSTYLEKSSVGKFSSSAVFNESKS